MSNIPRTVLIFLALAASVRSQVPTGSNPGTDPAARLARSFEKGAHDALVRYFADNTFLVRARVELDDASDLAADPQGPAALPNLPGLPYQPSGITREPIPALEDRIRAVDLDVLVDTAYTQRDRDFIQYLVVVAANLDTSRGDLVRVSRAAFPRDDRSLRRTEPWTDPAPVVRKSDSTPARKDTVAGPPPGLGRQFVERLIAQLPLILVCLSVLVALWLFRRPSWKQVTSVMKDRFKGKSKEPEHSSAPAVSSASPGAGNGGSGSVGGANQDMRTLRPFLVNCFIGEPRTSGQILKSWIDHDQAKGARDAGVLISGLNPRLLDTVREILGDDGAKLVEAQLVAKEDVPDNEFLPAGREFRREFQVATQRHGDRRQSDLFGFLEQLNEGQILHILKDEPLGISGFVLAQVSAAKAASILQGLDSPTRARFMYAIGSITQIPREVYKDIADRLSLKAMEVANMKFVAADGVESLLKLIESLPVEQQFPYIHSLSEVDLNLAKKLRARTVTLPEIPTLPEKFLAARLQALDPESLALVLPRYDAQARDRMFSLLPERMRLLIQSSLESRRHAPAQEVEAACQKVLRAFRDEIRHNGRPA